MWVKYFLDVEKIEIHWIFSSIIASLYVILITESTALESEWDCTNVFNTLVSSFRPAHKYCKLSKVDLSENYRETNYKFTGSEEDRKSLQNISEVLITDVPKLDFIPLQIIREFPNLDGLNFIRVGIPIIKDTLFTVEFIIIEYLDLANCKVQMIEENAFQHLKNLRTINLLGNSLISLGKNTFTNNQKLLSIQLYDNKIKMIHPQTFASLKKLEKVDLLKNECVDRQFGKRENSYSINVEFEQMDLELKECYSRYSDGEELLFDCEFSSFLI